MDNFTDMSPNILIKEVKFKIVNETKGMMSTKQPLFDRDNDNVACWL